jgi:large subunit ribosomal protein L29
MKNSFKNLSFAELKAKRDELNRKYLELRFQMVIGHVENPLQKRTMRRQIARLNTLIRMEEIAQAKAALKEAAAGAQASGVGNVRRGGGGSGADSAQRKKRVCGHREERQDG